MPYRKLSAACFGLIMFLSSLLNSHSLASPLQPAGALPVNKISLSEGGLPSVLILASYHSGDAWTDTLVRNLQYHLRSANENLHIRVHYLGARDLEPSRYLNISALHNSIYQLADYDRLVLLDDAALNFYLTYSAWFSDRPPIAIGINDRELISRAQAEGVPLAQTSSAIARSALLAQQISTNNDLLLLHSATEAGALLKQQALSEIEPLAFDSVTTATWQKIYLSDVSYLDRAVLAVDEPLNLARSIPNETLASVFTEKLGPIFCHAPYIVEYGCDGGAFVNIAGLTDLIARRLTTEERLGTSLDTPLELSLAHQWLDRLPEGLDVSVFNVPEPTGLPAWGWRLVLGLCGLLVVGGLIAAWRLHYKQQLINYANRESEFDALTRIYNRKKMLSLLEAMIAERQSGSLLYLDLTDFIQIYDEFGYAHGDTLLQRFAQRLGRIIGSQGAYGRLGDDKFMVLCHQSEQPEAMARAIVQALEKPFTMDRYQHTLKCSIGIAHFPHHASGVDRLLKCADAAMYTAKFVTQQPIVMFTERMLNRQVRHSYISRDLERAIRHDSDELELYLQPIYSLKQRAVVGGEVLLRWKHPIEGYISPQDFIPIAEASDLIFKINDWVVASTLQKINKDKLLRYIDYVSINISAKQLYTAYFPDYVAELAERYRIPPSSVAFELTEHVKLLNMASVQEQINNLQTEGFQVALDDFGAGYTSINFLQNINFSAIKIDRSLTAGLIGDNAVTSRHLMQGLLGIGERLSKKMVVEGIESKEQNDILEAMGVNYVQGFYYGRPMAWQAFHTMLKEA